MTYNETRLTVAIADLVIYEGLSFNLSQKPRFNKVLDLARNVTKFYQPPNINLVSKDILDVIHDQNMERNLSLIEKESDVFGLLFLGDGATISIIPLLKILISGKNIPVDELELIDCQGHLSYGRENDGTFICNRFIEHRRTNDPYKSIIDFVMFDGASNAQLAVKLLKTHIQRFQLCVGLNTLYPYFSIMFTKSQL